MSTVALFNDTGNQHHVGCRAVSMAHETMLREMGITVAYRASFDQWHELWRGTEAASCAAVRESPLLQTLRDVDAVVVNGEGTIHHGYGPNLLAILHVAQEEGKPTFLVNALLQDCPHFRDALSRLTDCVVRDRRSADYLAGLGIPHRLVPDSILACPWEAEPTMDLAGKLVVTDWHPWRDGDVGKQLRALLRRYGEGAVFYPLEHPDRAADWRHTVANFATARMVLTGRHHGVYLAALAGIPFIAFPSNSHKVEGLLAMSPAAIPLGRFGPMLRVQIRRVLRHPAGCTGLAEVLRGQLPLATFRELGACLNRPGRV